MTNDPAHRVKLVMLVTLSALWAAPVRAGGPVFMNAFDQWQADDDHGDEAAIPVAIARSPDGKHVYVARDHSYYITVLSRDPVTGALGFIADTPSSYAMYPICDLVDGVGTCHSAFDSAQALAFSPDGRHLYACFQTPARIVAYERDPIDGTLTEADSVPAPGAFYCNLAVSHDGAEIYGVVGGHADHDARCRHRVAHGSAAHQRRARHRSHARRRSERRRPEHLRRR